MVHTITEGVVFDDAEGSVTFTESSSDSLPILHLLEYAEEANPYQSWEETVAQILPMLDRTRIASLTFKRVK